MDTKAIVDSVRRRLEEGIQREIIAPFIHRSDALTKQVLPTLNSLKKVSEEAHACWKENIWGTAWAGSLSVAGSVLGLAILILVLAFESHAERKTAAAIHEVSRVMSDNKEAFRQLATVGATIRVLRTQDNTGNNIPGGYVLVLEKADSAEVRTLSGVRHGMIFFTSPVNERVSQEIERQSEHLLETPKEKAK